jgi:hypothetical protein
MGQESPAPRKEAMEIRVVMAVERDPPRMIVQECN